MMDRFEAESLLQEVIACKRELDAQWKALHKFLDADTESPFGFAVWRPMELLIDYLANLLEDDCGCVNWFIWDNDCGAKGLKTSLLHGPVKPIRDVEDLLDILGK